MSTKRNCRNRGSFLKQSKTPNNWKLEIIHPSNTRWKSECLICPLKPAPLSAFPSSADNYFLSTFSAIDVVVKSLSHVRLFVTAWIHCPWNFPGKSTGVGCHFLLQGIKPRSPALQADALLSAPPGRPTPNSFLSQTTFYSSGNLIVSAFKIYPKFSYCLPPLLIPPWLETFISHYYYCQVCQLLLLSLYTAILNIAIMVVMFLRHKVDLITQGYPDD